MYRIYAIVILSILLLASIGAGGYIYKEWRSERAEKLSVISLNGEANKTIDEYTNKNNNLVAINESIQLESKTIKLLHSEKQLAILDEFKGLKKNYKNLENLIQASLKVGGSISVPIKPDSTFSHHDEFRDLLGSIEFVQDSGFSVHITDTTTVPLALVVYWKRKWFLGKETYSVEGTSSNKKVKIVGLESIQVKRKK